MHEHPQSTAQISSRKDQHLDLCIGDDVEAGTTWMDAIAFIHNSLPELPLEEIDLSTPFLGKTLALPLLVTGMTGGSTRAANVNRIVAEACQKSGVAMGLGSQRAMLRDPEWTSSYFVRDIAPDILLLGNIGGVQLRETSVSALHELLVSVGADALCVHLNPAQEMLQPGGDRDFVGVLDAIRRAADAFPGKIIVKETGAGLAPSVVRRLRDAGVTIVDVSGVGGTSWTKVERLRGDAKTTVFDDWGIPTAVALVALKGSPITRIASGGLRHGLDVARALGLGAQLAGMALPVLKAADSGGVAAVERLFHEIRDQLLFVCVNTGARKPADLARHIVVTDPRVETWAAKLRTFAAAQALQLLRDDHTTPPATANSRISGFYRLSVSERIDRIAAEIGWEPDEVSRAVSGDSLEPAAADKMVENALGIFTVPIGVGLNLRVNDRDFFVPMSVEEPSVVAAVSRAALVARPLGGFTASCDDSMLAAQIHLADVPDPELAQTRIREAAPELLAIANQSIPRLVARGGGARRIDTRIVTHAESQQQFFIVHVTLDVLAAMGANLANTVAEAVAPRLAELTGGRIVMRILSNLCDERIARARFEAPFDALAFGGVDGERAAKAVVEGYRLADADPYRAVTHNKGVMNGIDAVALALGQDTRAIEAAAHAWAARDGSIRSLTRFGINPDKKTLWGDIAIPMPISTVAPNIKSHLGVRFAHRLINYRDIKELSGLIAAVGLAQNFGAVHALVTEGIQHGHMRLHARRFALSANVEESP